MQITTVAGTGVRGTLAAPNAVFVDAVGNLYILDTGNHRIQKWAPGAIAVTLAGGNGTGNGPNQLSSPKGMFVDAGGTLYIADVSNK